jgi:hypothetical protein
MNFFFSDNYADFFFLRWVHLKLQPFEDVPHEFPVHVGAFPVAQAQVGVEHVVLKNQAEPAPKCREKLSS